MGLIADCISFIDHTECTVLPHYFSICIVLIMWYLHVFSLSLRENGTHYLLYVEESVGSLLLLASRSSIPFEDSRSAHDI